MIWNVIDQRKRPYRWMRVNAIIEAIEHDNSCLEADQAEEASPSLVIDHERRDHISVREAIDWAHEARCPVTLYLYDADGDATERHFSTTGDRFPENDGTKHED